VPKRVDHSQRRQTIIDALNRRAARRGLGAITIRVVAAEAGVSVGQVQHYFANKDEMLLAALTQLTERVGHRMRSAVVALGPDATERDLIRSTLVEFLPLDDERRAAMVLFRAYHEGGVNNLETTGATALEVPRAFDTLMRTRLESAKAAGRLRSDVSIKHEAAIYQMLVTSLAEGVIAGLTSPRQALNTIDYVLDRAFELKSN
jgi:AcrR family transcriptional regulator